MKAIKYTPIVIWTVYSSLLLICFWWGPFLYQVDDEVNFNIYVVAINLVVPLGYYFGINREFKEQKYTLGFLFEKNIILFLFVMIIPFTILNLQGFDVSQISSDQIIEGRENFNTNYNGSWVAFAGVFLSLSIIPFIAYYFLSPKKLNISILLLLYLIGILIASIFYGKRSSLYANLIYFTIPLILVYGRNRWSRKSVGVAGAVALFIIASFYVISLVSDRARSEPGDSYADFVKTAFFEYGTKDDIELKEDHPFLSGQVPTELEAVLLQGTFYFGHEYYGLNLCWQVKDEKPFGFGLAHSDAILRNVVRVVDDDRLFKVSFFRYLIDKNWISQSLWISLYGWYASDFGFYGILPLFLFFGYLLGSSWKSSLVFNDPLSIITCIWIFSILMHTHVGFSAGDYVSTFVFYYFVFKYTKTYLV